MRNKYDKITEKLILKSMEFNVQMKFDFSLPETVFILREAFKEKDIREQVLGHNDYPDNASCGFCFVSSQYILQTSLNPDDWEFYKLSPDFHHWYLKEKSTNKILDITFDQFYEEPYYKTGFVYDTKKLYPEVLDILNNKVLTLAEMANLPIPKHISI